MRVLYLLIPVLNEARNIKLLIANIVEVSSGLVQAAGCHELRVLLIDDGSTDGTGDVASEMCGNLDIEVLRHDWNRGPGAAFATGFSSLALRLHESDRVMTLEGDNTSRLDTGRRLLIRLREGYDSVLASPYAYGGGFRQTSLLRLILSHGANGTLKSLVGIHGIHTMSSFFRVYTGELVLRLQKTFGPGIIERTGFECMVELIIKMILLGASVSEVEMVLDSSARIGKSKMKILRTIAGYLAIIRVRRKWERQASSHMWGYVLRKGKGSQNGVADEDQRG